MTASVANTASWIFTVRAIMWRLLPT
jgi:hypothetical protein